MIRRGAGSGAGSHHTGLCGLETRSRVKDTVTCYKRAGN